MKGIEKPNTDGEDSKDRDILKKTSIGRFVSETYTKIYKKNYYFSFSLHQHFKVAANRAKKISQKASHNFSYKIVFFSKQFLCVWGKILKFLLPAIFYLKYSTVYTIYSLDMYKVLHSETEGEYGLFLSSSSEPH